MPTKALMLLLIGAGAYALYRYGGGTSAPAAPTVTASPRTMHAEEPTPSNDRRAPVPPTMAKPQSPTANDAPVYRAIPEAALASFELADEIGMGAQSLSDRYGHLFAV